MGVAFSDTLGIFVGSGVSSLLRGGEVGVAVMPVSSGVLVPSLLGGGEVGAVAVCVFGGGQVDKLACEVVA